MGMRYPVEEGEVAAKHQWPEHGWRALRGVWYEKRRHEGVVEGQTMRAKFGKSPEKIRRGTVARQGPAADAGNSGRIDNSQCSSSSSSSRRRRRRRSGPWQGSEAWVGQVPTCGSVSASPPTASSPLLHQYPPKPQPIRHDEAIRGVCRLITVLRCPCSSAHRQPRDCASHHCPAPGPVAIPLARACRCRDAAAHQHVRRTAPAAVWGTRRRRLQGPSAHLGRGRGPEGANRWASTTSIVGHHTG